MDSNGNQVRQLHYVCMRVCACAVPCASFNKYYLHQRVHTRLRMASVPDVADKSLQLILHTALHEHT